jgi:DNA helicase-2/ATP-dependent DNA helicase PcrA
VAFSRPLDILLLVGITNAIEGYDTKHDHHNILNVATGWTRDGNCKGLGNITYLGVKQ